jgi:hypothetical protein
MLSWNTFQITNKKNICLEIIILKKSQADMLKLQFKNKYAWWRIIINIHTCHTILCNYICK